MKKLIIISLVLILTIFLSCQQSKSTSEAGQAVLSGKVSLPEIDISGTPDGIVPLPDNVPAIYKDVFVKYTKIIAPNGKPIHLLAQDGWSNYQIKKARNVLQYLLTSMPGSIYGSDKTAVANSMADRKAAMVLFNTEEDMRQAMSGPLGEKAELNMQDLRANECPAEGTEDYMNHITRDASFEEIWHLVHDNGVKQVLPEMIAEMRIANDAAAKKGWRAWPEDQPQEHPNEYMGVLLDNYFDLWAVKPKKYEGRDIAPGAIPDGTSHFGRYFANSRAKMKKLDPHGYALIEKFFVPYLTFNPELPENFKGTFSLEFDPSLIYTYKSQHLVNVTLTGNQDANLIGNAYDNILTGNNGSNWLKGGAGDDRLDGGKGEDTAVYSGPQADYIISKNKGIITIMDKKANRDGIDTLLNMEIIKFSDSQLKL
ncbi:MAG: hypothetical protein ACE5GI_04440 [Candidatus Aminicenantales bacterium]